MSDCPCMDKARFPDYWRTCPYATPPVRTLNLCAHGADFGTWCGYCRGYSQGSGMAAGLPTNETMIRRSPKASGEPT
jgi:hypothetical protein